MTERAASTTATGVAWLHAAHQLIDSVPRVLDDPIIARLMGATPHLMAEREGRLQSPRARALRAHVVARTRFAEDRLEQAVARGVRQYVVLGAGMDTFAYRQPAWAKGVHVFEVDQPATQSMKRHRVAAADIQVPDNVTYVAIDFETEALADGLGRGGVQLDQPAFFAWLGVTMYLTEAAIDAVLRTITALPPSSEIVFTFAPSREPTDAGPEPTLAEQAAAVGEPWVTYFEPEALYRQLVGLGFSGVEFLTAADAWMRYFRDRSDGLPSPRRTSIVSATV
jgi:methyltransferase (TIGR00027 family)